MKKVIKVFLMSAVSVVGLFCAVPNAMCKESKPAPSYYTVKTEKDLRDAVNLSNKGDTIVITGDIELNSTLTIPKDKEVTIANDREVRTIKRGNTISDMIRISQGATLTLKGINGTDEKPSLLIDGDGDNKASKIGQIVWNIGTFNMYTGVSLQNNKIEETVKHGPGSCIEGCAVLCKDNSTFNMYGGSISHNQTKSSGCYYINGRDPSYCRCCGVIYLKSGSTFNISGGIISNNTCSSGDSFYDMGIIYCASKSRLNMSGGEISKNTVGIYGDSSSIVNMTNGRITENRYGIYSWGKVVMSGGLIDNNTKGLKVGGEFVLSQDAQIVANPICLKKGKKIIIDGYILGNKDSFMRISLSEYILFNNQKVIDVINGAKLIDVLGKFKLCNCRYGINSEGYVDDIYQDFEEVDAGTGIRISSWESVLNRDVEINITKVDSIDNVKGATFYIESLCDNVKSFYSVKFTSDGKQYIPEKTDTIAFYIPIKEFDTGKIPEVKLYDSNKKTISEDGDVKAVKGMLYIRIPTTENTL